MAKLIKLTFKESGGEHFFRSTLPIPLFSPEEFPYHSTYMEHSEENNGYSRIKPSSLNQ